MLVVGLQKIKKTWTHENMFQLLKELNWNILNNALLHNYTTTHSSCSKFLVKYIVLQKSKLVVIWSFVLMKSTICIRVQWSRTYFRSLGRYLASKTHSKGHKELLNLHFDENVYLQDLLVWWREQINRIGTSVHTDKTLLHSSWLSVKIKSV